MVQHRFTQPCFIAEAQRGQDSGRRRGAYQAFALKRRPYPRVAQTGRLTRGYDCLADVKVIAVRIRQANQRDAPGLLTASRR